MIITRNIRKAFRAIGLDIHLYRKPNYKWLIDLNINTILDIGANTGQFSKKYSQFLPNVKIYAFEPIQSCFNELRENTRKLNIECYNFALGENNYFTEINVSKHTPSSSILEMAQLHKEVFEQTKQHSKKKIEVKRLDNFILGKNLKKNILVKIDVQGFENKVIDGAKAVLKECKIVLIEMSYLELYKKQLLFDDIYEKLRVLGFRFQGNLSQTLNPDNGYILYSDSIFVK